MHLQILLDTFFSSFFFINYLRNWFEIKENRTLGRLSCGRRAISFCERNHGWQHDPELLCQLSARYMIENVTNRADPSMNWYGLIGKRKERWSVIRCRSTGSSSNGSTTSRFQDPRETLREISRMPVKFPILSRTSRQTFSFSLQINSRATSTTLSIRKFRNFVSSKIFNYITEFSLC